MNIFIPCLILVVSLRLLHLTRSGNAELLHELQAYDFGNSIFYIVGFFLEKRVLKVDLDGQSSTIYNINDEVHQASVLQLILFLSFTNVGLDDALLEVLLNGQ